METRQLSGHNLARMPLTVVMNAASGSDDKRAVREAIHKALTSGQRDVRMMLASRPQDIGRLAREAVEDGKRQARIIVAAGGDGTLNGVANALVGSGLPMAVIPLGTFNYFARDLGIPLDPAAAAAAIGGGSVRHVQAARIDGRVFLINANLGLYRELQEKREQDKRRFGRNRIIAVISGFVTLLRDHRALDVRMEVDGQLIELRTPLLFFGNNRLQLENLGLPAGECMTAGRLAMLALRPMGRSELVLLALRGALRGLRDATKLERYYATQIEVRGRPGSSVRVAVDGEVMSCRMPLRVEVLRDALPVVVPANPRPRQ